MTEATNHNAFLITYDRAERITADLTLDAMQQAVDGYIEAVFTVPSPAGGSRYVTGYCNEEGKLRELQPTTVLEHDGWTDMIAGPLFITGLDDSTGETVPLTNEELDWVERRVRLLASAGRYNHDTDTMEQRSLHMLCVGEDNAKRVFVGRNQSVAPQ
jgi:hypothetical protein